MSPKINARDNRTVWILRVIVLALFSAGPILAAEKSEDWEPDPPMPDKFDWVQMTSGEWLKGEIIAMHNETLEFDSAEFDEQSLDWEDIQAIRSAQTCQVRFSDETIVTGKILREYAIFRVLNGHDIERDSSTVLSITPGEPRERNYWAGKISAGLNVRTGNSEQTDFTAKAVLIRRTPKSRINLDYLGDFSETENTTITDSQRLESKWDRYISNRLYWTPIFGEIFRDRSQNIAAKYTLGIGLGYTIKHSSRIDWDVNAGLAYQQTDFFDVLPDEDDTEASPAVLIGTKYENQLTGWLDYHLSYTLNFVNEKSGTYTHHMVTGFEFDLIGDLDFDVDWVWDYVLDPRQDSDGVFPENSDFRMMVSLGYNF